MSSLDVFPEEPHRELQASEEFFLSILPLGMKRSLDIDGWVLQLPPHSDAAAEMIHDFEVKTSALELLCSQHDKLRATFPDDFKYIGTPLPVLVLQVKNLSKFFSFDIIVEDTSGQTRTISASNKDNLIRFDALHARLPLRLVPGWNSVVLDLSALVRRMFNAEYRHATRIHLHANCRVLRIFFCDRLYKERELPSCLRLFPNE